MKDVIYLPGIRRDPEVFLLAEQATGRLEEMLKDFAPIVSAEWDMVEERGPAEVSLRIWEDTGSVTGRFQSRELRDPERIDHRLGKLWSDLLRVRSHALLKRLGTLVQQLDGE